MRWRWFITAMARFWFAPEMTVTITRGNFRKAGLTKAKRPRKLPGANYLKRHQYLLTAALSEAQYYDFPPEILEKFRKMGRRNIGQKQYSFLFRFLGRDEEIDLGQNGEFRAWKWVDIAEAVTGVKPFKKAVYQKIAEEFTPYLAS